MCANDFGTYANECEMSKYVCEAYDESHHENINITHEGQCTGDTLFIFFCDMRYSILFWPLKRYFYQAKQS